MNLQAGHPGTKPARWVLWDWLMSHRLSRTTAKLAVSVGLFWLICRNLDLADVARRFVGQSPGWIVAAGIATLTQIPLAALRWQRMLRALGIQISGRTVLSVTFVGSFFNAWFLGNGSGDVARAVLAPSGAQGRGSVVHSVLFDRAATLAGIGLTILPVMILDIGPLARGAPVLISFAVLAAPFLALVWLRPIAGLMARWELPLAGIAGGLVDSLRALRRSWRQVAVALALAVMSQAAVTLAAYSLAQAQHLDVALVDFLVVMPPVLLLSAVPISIGGWGVRENVLVFGLAPLGVAAGSALLVGVQIGLLGSLLSLPGGAIWLFGQVLRRRAI